MRMRWSSFTFHGKDGGHLQVFRPHIQRIRDELLEASPPGGNCAEPGLPFKVIIYHQKIIISPKSVLFLHPKTIVEGCLYLKGNGLLWSEHNWLLWSESVMGYYGACMMGYYGLMVYGSYDQVAIQAAM